MKILSIFHVLELVELSYFSCFGFTWYWCGMWEDNIFFLTIIPRRRCCRRHRRHRHRFVVWYSILGPRRRTVSPRSASNLTHDLSRRRSPGDYARFFDRHFICTCAPLMRGERIREPPWWRGGCCCCQCYPMLSSRRLPPRGDVWEPRSLVRERDSLNFLHFLLLSKR